MNANGDTCDRSANDSLIVAIQNLAAMVGMRFVPDEEKLKKFEPRNCETKNSAQPEIRADSHNP